MALGMGLNVGIGFGAENENGSEDGFGDRAIDGSGNGAENGTGVVLRMRLGLVVGLGRELGMR